jgi:S-adenosylmethionine hydrolase
MRNIMKIITFLTDFGMKSGYPAQMKGVVSSLTNARYVDITHDIARHNINEGAFVLYTTAPYFPIGTVHVAVVDPGVGTDRRGIIVTTRSQILIGPDNGLLLPTAHLLGDFIVYEIINERYMLSYVSDTFHGRDVFSPVAAHIVNGVPFDEIGRRINDFIDLDFGGFKISNKSANGKVIYIDSFGNIITNIIGNQLRNILDYNNKIMLEIDGKQKTLPFVKSYNFVKKGQYLLTINSSNMMEIGINQGNATQKLGVKPGSDIKIFFD